MTVNFADALTSGTPGTIKTSSSFSASTPAAGRDTGMPLVIRADQAYYWSRAWQQGEANAWRDIEAGDFDVYDSPADAVRGLHRVD